MMTNEQRSNACAALLRGDIAGFEQIVGEDNINDLSIWQVIPAEHALSHAREKQLVLDKLIIPKLSALLSDDTGVASRASWIGQLYRCLLNNSAGYLTGPLLILLEYLHGCYEPTVALGDNGSESSDSTVFVHRDDWQDRVIGFVNGYDDGLELVKYSFWRLFQLLYKYDREVAINVYRKFIPLIATYSKSYFNVNDLPNDASAKFEELPQFTAETNAAQELRQRVDAQYDLDITRGMADVELFVNSPAFAELEPEMQWAIKAVTAQLNGMQVASDPYLNAAHICNIELTEHCSLRVSGERSNRLSFAVDDNRVVLTSQFLFDSLSSDEEVLPYGIKPNNNIVAFNQYSLRPFLRAEASYALRMNARGRVEVQMLQMHLTPNSPRFMAILPHAKSRALPEAHIIGYEFSANVRLALRQHLLDMNTNNASIDKYIWLYRCLSAIHRPTFWSELGLSSINSELLLALFREQVRIFSKQTDYFAIYAYTAKRLAANLVHYFQPLIKERSVFAGTLLDKDKVVVELDNMLADFSYVIAQARDWHLKDVVSMANNLLGEIGRVPTGSSQAENYMQNLDAEGKAAINDWLLQLYNNLMFDDVELVVYQQFANSIQNISQEWYEQLIAFSCDNSVAAARKINWPNEVGQRPKSLLDKRSWLGKLHDIFVLPTAEQLADAEAKGEPIVTTVEDGRKWLLKQTAKSWLVDEQNRIRVMPGDWSGNHYVLPICSSTEYPLHRALGSEQLATLDNVVVFKFWPDRVSYPVEELVRGIAGDILPHTSLLRLDFKQVDARPIVVEATEFVAGRSMHYMAQNHIANFDRINLLSFHRNYLASVIANFADAHVANWIMPEVAGEFLLRLIDFDQALREQVGSNLHINNSLYLLNQMVSNIDDLEPFMAFLRLDIDAFLNAWCDKCIDYNKQIDRAFGDHVDKLFNIAKSKLSSREIGAPVLPFNDKSPRNSTMLPIAIAAFMEDLRQRMTRLRDQFVAERGDMMRDERFCVLRRNQPHLSGLYHVRHTKVPDLRLRLLSNIAGTAFTRTAAITPIKEIVCSGPHVMLPPSPRSPRGNDDYEVASEVERADKMKWTANDIKLLVANKHPHSPKYAKYILRKLSAADNKRQKGRDLEKFDVNNVAEQMLRGEYDEFKKLQFNLERVMVLDVIRERYWPLEQHVRVNIGENQQNPRRADDERRRRVRSIKLIIRDYLVQTPVEQLNFRLCASEVKNEHVARVLRSYGNRLLSLDLANTNIDMAQVFDKLARIDCLALERLVVSNNRFSKKVDVPYATFDYLQVLDLRGVKGKSATRLRLPRLKRLYLSSITDPNLINEAAGWLATTADMYRGDVRFQEKPPVAVYLSESEGEGIGHGERLARTIIRLIALKVLFKTAELSPKTIISASHALLAAVFAGRVERQMLNKLDWWQHLERLYLGDSLGYAAARPILGLVVARTRNVRSLTFDISNQAQVGVVSYRQCYDYCHDLLRFLPTITKLRFLDAEHKCVAKIDLEQLFAGLAPIGRVNDLDAKTDRLAQIYYFHVVCSLQQVDWPELENRYHHGDQFVNHILLLNGRLDHGRADNGMMLNMQKHAAIFELKQKLPHKNAEEIIGSQHFVVANHLLNLNRLDVAVNIDALLEWGFAKQPNFNWGLEQLRQGNPVNDQYFYFGNEHGITMKESRELFQDTCERLFIHGQYERYLKLTSKYRDQLTTELRFYCWLAAEMVYARPNDISREYTALLNNAGPNADQYALLHELCRKLDKLTAGKILDYLQVLSSLQYAVCLQPLRDEQKNNGENLSESERTLLFLLNDIHLPTIKRLYRNPGDTELVYGYAESARANHQHNKAKFMYELALNLNLNHRILSREQVRLARDYLGRQNALPVLARNAVNMGLFAPDVPNQRNIEGQQNLQDEAVIANNI